MDRMLEDCQSEVALYGIGLPSIGSSLELFRLILGEGKSDFPKWSLRARVVVPKKVAHRQASDMSRWARPRMLQNHAALLLALEPMTVKL